MTDTTPERRKGVSAETFDPSKEESLDDQPLRYYKKTDDQKKRLVENIRNILIFRNLNPGELDATLNAMFEKKINKGDVIVKENDDEDYFYVIEEGIFEVLKTSSNSTQMKVLTYNNSGFFGELALMYNQPRAATVRAVTDGLLWCMDRQSFRKIVLRGAFNKRKKYENLVKNVNILAALPEYDCLKITDALVSVYYEPGQQIIKQGDQADGIYFIESGDVVCKVSSTGNVEDEKVVNNLSQGDYFGELAILFDKPRIASVYAVTAVSCAFLDVDAFERLIGPYSKVMSAKFSDYHEQLKKIVGMDFNFSDLRS